MEMAAERLVNIGLPDLRLHVEVVLQQHPDKRNGLTSYDRERVWKQKLRNKHSVSHTVVGTRTCPRLTGYDHWTYYRNVDVRGAEDEKF